MTQKSLVEGEPSMVLSSNLPLALASKLAVAIDYKLQEYCFRVAIAGSIRRRKSTVNDIDLVVVTDDKWEQVKKDMRTLFRATPIVSGEKVMRFWVPFHKEVIQVDINRATEDTYGMYLLIRTGSMEHNIYLAKLALKMHMRLKYSEGLIYENRVVAGKDEGGIFRNLGLHFIPPEKREIVDGKPLWELGMLESP